MTEVPLPRQSEENHEQLANLATKRNVYFAASALLDLVFNEKISFVTCENVLKAPNRRDTTRSVYFRGRVDNDVKSLKIVSETSPHEQKWVKVAWEDDTYRRTQYAKGDIFLPEACDTSVMSLGMMDNRHRNESPELTVTSAQIATGLIHEFRAASQQVKP